MSRYKWYLRWSRWLFSDRREADGLIASDLCWVPTMMLIICFGFVWLAVYKVFPALAKEPLWVSLIGGMMVCVAVSAALANALYGYGARFTIRYFKAQFAVKFGEALPNTRPTLERVAFPKQVDHFQELVDTKLRELSAAFQAAGEAAANTDTSRNRAHLEATKCAFWVAQNTGFAVGLTVHDKVRKYLEPVDRKGVRSC